MQLIEIAPGVDLKRDILDQMGFEPIIKTPVKLMNKLIFQDSPMGIKNGW